MTTDREEGHSAPATGAVRHHPVLVREIVEWLQPREGGLYVDGTFGAGGYSRAILAAAECRVVAIDRDRTAVAAGASLVDRAGGRLTVVEGRFSNLEDAVAEPADGVVLDLGVSSMQLDTPERGFSFRFDAPLDMRMGSEGPTAADLLVRAAERDLANIIYLLGEERQSRAIARAIVRSRTETPLTTTRQLADLVSRIVRSKPGDIHPATRTFQALRLYVNDELGELSAGLAAAERVLKPGGRLVVVSFHSLEDRIVKNFITARSGSPMGSRHLPMPIRHEPSLSSLTKRPIVPGGDEVAHNPRARSAKLRAAERTAAPPHADTPSLLPDLPTPAEIFGGRIA